MTPLEPRLIKKLVPPLLEIIQKTRAISLVYESMHTIIVGGMIPPLGSADAELPINVLVVSICVEKLKLLIEHDDQNCTPLLI